MFTSLDFLFAVYQATTIWAKESIVSRVDFFRNSPFRLQHNLSRPSTHDNIKQICKFSFLCCSFGVRLTKVTALPLRSLGMPSRRSSCERFDRPSFDRTEKTRFEKYEAIFRLMYHCKSVEEAKHLETKLQTMEAGRGFLLAGKEALRSTISGAIARDE